MALIRTLNGVKPKLGKNYFLAETAVVIGDVETGDNCSIWYGAVLRGDVSGIRIGNCTNIQDGAVIHGSFKTSQTIIGNNVTIGHNATIHGATVKDNVLIGMGSTILDNAVVNSNVIVAAGALVLGRTVLEANSVYAGVPAKKVKDLSPAQCEAMITKSANHYIDFAEWYKGNEEEYIDN